MLILQTFTIFANLYFIDSNLKISIIENVHVADF